MLLAQVLANLVDVSATRQAGGAGLGLALAKHLVEAQGEQIGVDSPEGHGATFWFTIPISEEGSEIEN